MNIPSAFCCGNHRRQVVSEGYFRRGLLHYRFQHTRTVAPEGDGQYTVGYLIGFTCMMIAVADSFQIAETGKGTGKTFAPFIYSDQPGNLSVGFGQNYRLSVHRTESRTIGYGDIQGGAGCGKLWRMRMAGLDRGFQSPVTG